MDSHPTFSLLSGFFDGLRPSPEMSVAEWADKFRILSSRASREAGPYRTSRTPYLREIMESLSSLSPYQHVILMKGAQVGASEAGFNWLGFTIDLDPCPMLIINPTATDMEKNSKLRIAPMISDSPSLKDKIGEAKSRDGSNSTLYKEYPGGVLILAGAKSASSLRSMPIKKIFFDEVDAYDKDVGKEGSPIALAEKRTSTFGSEKKIFKISTPAIRPSAIEEAYLETDQRKYFVPCPHCDEVQTIEWDSIHYDEGKPETAVMVCIHCAAQIEERHKPWMLKNGEWIATCPEKSSPTHVGYHISALYSPLGWTSWAEIAKKYIEAYRLNDEIKKKTFMNLELGLPYEPPTEVPDDEALYNAREKYESGTIPDGVFFLTCGIDVQRDRLELEIVGWGIDKESWSIKYITLRAVGGATSDLSDPCWDNLDAILLDVIDGMPITYSAIDSGDQSAIVYQYVNRCRIKGMRIVAIKGQDNQDIPIKKGKRAQINIAGKSIGLVTIFHVGVSMLKTELYGYLRLTEKGLTEFPPGYCHFPQDYTRDYFKQLTNEELLVEMDKRGYTVERWIKKGRNEPLDCRNYARAVASLVGIDGFDRTKFEAVRKQMSQVAMGVVPARKKRKKKNGPSYWDR